LVVGIVIPPTGARWHTLPEFPAPRSNRESPLTLKSKILPNKKGYSMFTHTSIRSSDMDRSIDFYTRIMGLKLLSRREIPQNNAEIVFLQDPEGKGAKLELTLYRNQKKFIQADYENRLFDHLAFEIKNMDDMISVMRREKVTITDEPFNLNPTGPLIAFIEDPDGTLIELIERK
jgi:lactoylglutathione lyase